MTKPWHMARVASRRELPKPRKTMGPVGDRLSEETLQLHSVPDWNVACRSCGMHVCSCDPYAHFKTSMAAFPGAEPAIMRYMRKGSSAFINGKLYFCAQDVPPDVLATLKVEAPEGKELGHKCRSDAPKPIHLNGCPCTGCLGSGPGNWEWAKRCMVYGSIVKREAWGSSYLRMRNDTYESIADRDHAERYPYKWVPVSLDDDEMSTAADWVVVSSDDHGLHVLLQTGLAMGLR